MAFEKHYFSNKTSLTKWYVLALVLIILDQITKIWVAKTLTFGVPVYVTGFFNLLLVYNEGAAFSFLASQAGWQRYFFVVISIAAVVLIVYWLRKHRNDKTFCLALSLLLSGAIGNLIDRFIYGHVIDFLDVHAFGYHWPTFNVADCGVTLGALLFIYVEFKRNKK